jgi:OmpA-OmpF porin, OOP family
MAAYVFESVERRLTPQMIRQISAFLDETPSSTRKAIAAAMPALIAGLNERASSTRGAETLLNVIHRVGLGLDLDELARGSGSFDHLHRAGRAVLPTIFGGRSSAVVARMAGESGLRLSSAAAALEMLAPLALAVIGREVVRHGLDEAGLIVLLADRRHEVTGILPAAGLSL